MWTRPPARTWPRPTPSIRRRRRTSKRRERQRAARRARRFRSGPGPDSGRASDGSPRTDTAASSPRRQAPTTPRPQPAAAASCSPVIPEPHTPSFSKPGCGSIPRVVLHWRVAFRRRDELEQPGEIRQRHFPALKEYEPVGIEAAKLEHANHQLQAPPFCRRRGRMCPTTISSRVSAASRGPRSGPGE